ncbi:hypothetical protein GCM10027519_47330 [Kineococcus endophyticus]
MIHHRRDSLPAALRALWSGGEVDAAVDAFTRPVPPSITHPGTSAALASFLLGGLHVTRYPVYRLTARQRV